MRFGDETSPPPFQVHFIRELLRFGKERSDLVRIQWWGRLTGRRVGGGRRAWRGQGKLASHLEVLLVAAPFLVATPVPIGEVHFGEGIGQGRVSALAEGGDDGVVSDSVEQHLVDAFARRLRQAGNFSVAFTAAKAVEQWVVCHRGLSFLKGVVGFNRS